MAQIRRTVPERRATSRIERRVHHVDKTPRILRIAGRIFGLRAEELAEEYARTARQRRQKRSPVGVGFGTDDGYGPDDDWNTVRYLNSISYQDYYNAARTE